MDPDEDAGRGAVHYCLSASFGFGSSLFGGGLGRLSKGRNTSSMMPAASSASRDSWAVPQIAGMSVADVETLEEEKKEK